MKGKYKLQNLLNYGIRELTGSYNNGKEEVTCCLNLETMILTDKIVMCILNILSLMAIYYQIDKRQAETLFTDRILRYLLLTTSGMFIIDTLIRCNNFSYNSSAFLNLTGNLILYASVPIIPILWLLLVHITFFKDEAKTIKLSKYLLTIVTIHIAVVCIFSGKDIFYYIDSANTFHRGTYFFLLFTTPAFVVLYLITTIILHYRQLHIRHIVAVIVCTTFGILGGILQYQFENTSILFPAITYILILVYLNIQNDRINEDYLTGLGSRSYFNRFLHNCMNKNSNTHYNFATIMIDIDDFKQINDTYGHLAGDQVLKDIAIVLRQAFGRKHMVCRFAGDEFCAVVHTDNKEDLEQLIDNLYNTLDYYNTNAKGPCPIMFSVGYLMYDRKQYPTDADYIQRIDQAMYDCKKKHKVQRA